MTIDIAIFDIGISNIQSVKNSLELLNIKFDIIKNWNINESYPTYKIFILPGVGSFDEGIKRLRSTGISDLIHLINQRNDRIIGICLGMQLLLDSNEESKSGQSGLGLIQAEVKKINFVNVKVPHIGWDKVKTTKFCPEDLSNFLNNDFYFLHSYYCNVDKEIVLSNVNLSNGISIPVAYKYKNIYGFQFHPEKSQEAGSALMNFLCLTN